MRRASFDVSTCIVRCESVRRSTHVLTSFGVSRKTNRQFRADALNILFVNICVILL